MRNMCTMVKCRGCRAIAYAYSSAKGIGDYLAEDPQCFIIILLPLKGDSAGSNA